MKANEPEVGQLHSEPLHESTSKAGGITIDCKAAGHKHKNEFKKKKEDGNISLPPRAIICPSVQGGLLRQLKFIIKWILNVRN